MLATLLVLAGCGERGESSLEAELARQQGERGFAVLSNAPERAVFAVRGQQIVVEPPKGYCLDRDAVDVSRRAAFSAVTDCLEDRQAELAQESAEGAVLAIELPRSFPGILTVTVSGEPAIGPDGAALDAFEVLLATPAGKRLLSRGNNGAAGTAVATRRVGRALYVLVEEDTGHASFLAPRFWRGFLEIRERLALVTVSSFTDRPIAEDGMMGFLALQMGQLRRANGMDAVAEEDEIARLMEAAFTAPTGEGVEVVRSDRRAVTEDGVAPAKAPQPVGRYALAVASGGGVKRSPVPVPRSGGGIVRPAASAEAPAAVTPTPRAAAAPASGAAPQSAPLPPKRRG